MGNSHYVYKIVKRGKKYAVVMRFNKLEKIFVNNSKVHALPADMTIKRKCKSYYRAQLWFGKYRLRQLLTHKY